MNFSAIKVCGAVLSLLFSAALALAQTTPTTLPIYTDSLQTPWRDTPAGATVLYTNTTPVKVGDRSISVTGGAGKMFSIEVPTTQAVNTTPYKSLKFWINGGTVGGQQLWVTLMNGTNELRRFLLHHAPKVNTWTQLEIPLYELGTTNSPIITGMRIVQDAGAVTTYYLDEILFSSEVVPSPARFIYDDMLHPEWVNNDIGNVIENYFNTSPVYGESSRSIAVTTANVGSGSFQGLRFNNIKAAKYDTSPYKSLSFQVHGGTTGGQNLAVRSSIVVGTTITQLHPLPIPIPEANKWTRVTVPLMDLGIDKMPDLKMIAIEEMDGQATTFYIDDVRFDTEAAPSVPLPVFDEFARGPWESNPHGSVTANITNTTQVKAGNRSIACTMTGDGAMKFRSSPIFDASPFASVSFWIHGGTTAAANRTGDIYVSLSRPGVISPRHFIPKPAANTWTQHTIPLSALGADGATEVSEILIGSLVAQPIFYLDDIQFNRLSAYTLTYSGNGHTGGTVPVAVGSPYVPGSTATIVGNTGNLTRGANFNFLGWNTAANGIGTNYAAGDTVVLNRNLVLYARWNYTGISYPLAYDGNGHSTGTVPVDTASPFIPGATVTVKDAPTLIRSGHTFGGWNTAADGTGTNYAAGATFAIAQATTLYAKWTPSTVTYSVVYHGNSPTSGTAPVDHASPRALNDLVIIADKANLVKTNEPFLGWNTAANGTGTRYFPGDRVRITANLTLYAQYGTQFLYPYDNYNKGLMDPQLTGWPISQAAKDYVVNKSESARRPGLESSNTQKMDFFSVTPVAGHWGWDKPGNEVAWYNTHKTLVDTVIARPGAEILLVGDSITSQWGGGQQAEPIAAWTQNFGDKEKLVNFGIGGDKTYNVLWRLDRANLVGNINPKAVVLQIGHNNMFFAELNNVQYAANYGIENVVDGIVWCVRNLRSKFPNTPIILVNVFPTLSPHYDKLKATRAALNARNLAATDPLLYELDLWDQLNLPPPGLGNPLYFKPLSTNPAFNDGVHLLDAGYQVWAAALKPLITAINAPTVRYDANRASGGTVPSDATTYANRATVTVRANSGNLSKSGHTFTGWNTRPDGSGTHYLANNTFPITAPTTLYATWVPSSTVRFTRNVVDAVVKASATATPATATFSVAISGATAPTFRWERASAGSDIFTEVAGAGAATAQMTVSAPLADHGVRYRVKVTSGATSVYSQAGALQVLPVVLAPATDYKYNLPDSFTNETYTSADGLTLGYRLFTPSDRVPGQVYPLVVVLPGKDPTTGKPMMALAASRFIAEQAVRKCYILVPICPLGKEWSARVTGANSPFQTSQNTELRLLRESIDALQNSPLPIDDNRLYLTGFNQGGYAVWDLLQREGARWAAAVPVLGGGDPTRIASVADTLPPIWAGHSWFNNALVPVQRTRDMVDALTTAGKSIIYSEYNGGRPDSGYEFFCGYKSPNLPMPPAQPHLTAWLFAQARNTAEVSFATVAGDKALPPWNQCAGAEFAGPVTSYDHFFWSWETKRTQWATEVPSNQAKVVFIGDSITDGWSSLSTDLPKFNGKVLNMGISGDMSRGVLTRIQDVIEVNPKAVSLLIGTNDIVFGPNPDAIASIIVNNIKAIITKLRAHRANLPIIVSTIMPTMTSTANTGPQFTINGLLKEALRDMPNVFICDVYDTFTKNPGGHRSLFADDLHPNAAGYLVWANALDTVFASAGLYATETETNARAWDGGGTNTLWSTRANWNTVRNGTGGDPDSSPSTGNIAVFNTTVRNSPTTATLSGNVAVDGIEVINTGATQLFTDNLDSRTLTLGAGGIDLKSGSGGLQIAESNVALKKISLVLAANQTWTNNSNGQFRLVSDSAPNINLGAFNLTLGGSGNFELPGRIGGTGGIVKTGTGRVTLHNAASSFTGPLTLQNGVWEARYFANVNTDSDLGKGSATSNPADLILGGGTLRHSFANVASTDRRFTLGSANARSGTLDSSAIDPAHTLSFTSTGALAYGGSGVRTLTLTGTNTGANRFAPDIANGTGGATSLVKSGSGRWVLEGTSTYTGTTSVNAGTLAVTGTLSTTAVTVASGATLTGNGLIGGSVTVASGGRLLLDVANTPTGQQALRFSGNLVLTAGHVVELNVPPFVAVGSYTLVTTAGITGSLGSVQISGPAGKLRVVGNSMVFTISHFDLWCAANAIAGAAADVTTVEGRTHFFNYAFGLNPTAGGQGLLIDTAGLRTHGKFSYTRRKPASSGLSYVHEFSTDLNAWQTFTPVTLVPNGGDPVESVTVELPTAQRSLNRIFIRVRASAP